MERFTSGHLEDSPLTTAKELRHIDALALQTELVMPCYTPCTGDLWPLIRLTLLNTLPWIS